LDAEKIRVIVHVLCSLGYDISDHRWIPVRDVRVKFTPSDNLKRVNDFIEASRNILLDFLRKKTAKNLVKTFSAHFEYNVWKSYLENDENSL
jgi:hypothetical protein